MWWIMNNWATSGCHTVYDPTIPNQNLCMRHATQMRHNECDAMIVLHHSHAVMPMHCWPSSRWILLRILVASVFWREPTCCVCMSVCVLCDVSISQPYTRTNAVFILARRGEFNKWLTANANAHTQSIRTMLVTVAREKRTYTTHQHNHGKFKDIVAIWLQQVEPIRPCSCLWFVVKPTPASSMCEWVWWIWLWSNEQTIF